MIAGASTPNSVAAAVSYWASVISPGKLRFTHVQPSSRLLPMITGTRLNAPSSKRKRGWSGITQAVDDWPPMRAARLGELFHPDGQCPENLRDCL